MTTADAVVDAEVVEETNRVEPNPQVGAMVATTPGPSVAVTPSVGSEDLVERLDVIKAAAQNAMVENVDYGKVPGTGKDCLLKPGAEKLGVLFQLDIQIENEKHFDGQHLTVSSKAVAYHAPTGARLGFGEGMCSTYESKYAYRQPKRICPKCGEEAVIKGKDEYGGGWLCWKKKDGCGAKFPDGDQSIEGQSLERVDNPDLPDTWNTVVKMAEKRARVDVVLAVTGASAIFTQDIEDQIERSESSQTSPESSSPEPAPEVFDRNRLAAACDRAGLNNEQRGRIGAFIGVTKNNDWSNVNPHRLRQCVEKIEAGDAKGLAIAIQGANR